MSIAKKVFLPMFVILLLVIGFSVFDYIHVSNTTKVRVFKKEVKDYQDSFQALYDSKRDIAVSNAIMFASNEYVVGGLLDRDRGDSLKGVNSILKEFRENTNLHHVKIHIHDADLHSFLRVWKPKKFGDDLSSFRKTIVKVKETKKPLVAIELGRAGMVLRGVAPVIEDGKYLGSVEFMQGFNSIVKEMKDDNKKLVVLLKDSYLHIATLLKKSKHIKGYSLAVNPKIVDMDFFSELDGVDITQTQKMLSDKKYLFISTALKDFSGNIVGYAVIGQKKSVVEDAINKVLSDIVNQIIIMIVAFLFVFIMLFIIIKKAVLSPLDNLTHRAKDLSSGDGDLTRKLEINGDDEIAQASREINNFIEKVRVITDEAKHISNENSSIANELSSTALEVGKLVENSTKATNETTAKTQEIKRRLETAVDDAKVARGDLEKVNEHMGEANKAILSLAHSIQTSASTEIELASKIQQLSSDAEQVKSVLTVISDIADQTNLLALNAAIEAARAGEHGRGFAVVADEVRKLAERTQKSLVEINATINVIVQSIVESSEEMSVNSKKVEELASSATSVEEKINEMSDMVNNAATKTSDAIEKSYSETQEDVDEIVEQVSTIDTISTQNARSMEEIASAAEHLNSMTEALNNKLGEFRT